MDGHQVKEMFKKGDTVRILRQEAKKAGWGRVNGGDYCPICMENGI